MTDFTSPRKASCSMQKLWLETSKAEAKRSGDAQVEGGRSTALDLLRVPQVPKGLRGRPSRPGTPFSPLQTLSLSLISLGDFTVPLWALIAASV